MHKLSTIRCTRVDNRRFVCYDPGYRSLGWAAFSIENREAYVVASGTVQLPETIMGKHERDARRKYDRFLSPEAMLFVARRVEKHIKEYRAVDVCYERIFFGRNVSSVVGVMEICGMIKLLAAENKALVFQYTPNVVKQAVTGNKQANKDQVIKAIESLTGYTPETDHEADAIACGVAHILELRKQP